MDDIQDIFFNPDAFYDLIDEGIYIPHYLMKDVVGIVAGGRALLKLLDTFQERAEYEKCAKIKEQLDVLVGDLQLMDTKYLNIDPSVNERFDIFTVEKEFAVKHIKDVVINGYNHTLTKEDFLHKSKEVICALLYSTYNPVIKNVFGLHIDLKDINPLMKIFNEEGLYNVDDMSYNLLASAIERVKLSFA